MAQQQALENTAFSGFRTFFGGMSGVGRKAQAIVGEFAKMSEENLDAGSKAAERLREAGSFQEFASIQSDLIKESYENTTNHYRKIAEIAITAPQEMAQSAREFASNVADAGRQGAEQAAEMTRGMGNKAANIAEKTSETAQSAVRGGRG